MATNQYLFEHGLLDETSLEFATLLENRIDFLKKQHPNHHKLIDFLASDADPTPNKKYTEWLTHRAIKGDLPTSTSKIREGLTWFSKARPTAHDTNIKNHTVSSMLDVAHIVKHTMGEAPTSLEKIYDQDGVQAFKIPNRATSVKMYGPGSKHETNWCTAANSHMNRFNETTGDKITVHLPNGRFMQFNHESAQLKDEKNNDVKLQDPEIRPYYDHIKKVVTSTANGDDLLTSWVFPESGSRYATHGKISDDEFKTLAKHTESAKKVAKNPFLKDEQYEHLFDNHKSTHSYLAANPSIPQHLFDRISSDHITEHTPRGYSPEKLHRIIDSSNEFWADQTSPNGKIEDARLLTTLSKSAGQKFDHSHIEKIASVHPNGKYASDTAIVNIGVHNKLPQKYTSDAFKQYIGWRENGFRTKSDFHDFISNNDIADHDFVEAAHGASDYTAYSLLEHPKVPQEAKDVIVNNMKQHPGSFPRLRHNLDNPAIPHDFAKSIAEKSNYSVDNTLESYADRKDADVDFIHNKLIKDKAELSDFSPFYERKLPVEIATHPIHVLNASSHIGHLTHFNKDDLHTMIDSLHKFSEDMSIQPSSKFAKELINHPNSNVSHYEKLHKLFGNDSMFREVLQEHPKVPNSVKEKI